MRLRPITLVSICAVLIIGCSDGGPSTSSTSSSGNPAGSSGNPAGSSGNPAGSSGGTPCVDTPAAVALEDSTQLGFSANDVLAKMGGSQSVQLKWVSGQTSYATHARADTQTALTLDFASAGATATFIDAKGGGCPSQGEGPCMVCQSRLEISIAVKVSTADGALDETAQAKLVTTSTQTATFSLDIAAPLKGNYLDHVTPQPGYDEIGMHIEAAYAGSFPGSRGVVPDAWNGYVAATVKASGPSTTLPVSTSHGYFPPETHP